MIRDHASSVICVKRHGAMRGSHDARFPRPAFTRAAKSHFKDDRDHASSVICVKRHGVMRGSRDARLQRPAFTRALDHTSRVIRVKKHGAIAEKARHDAFLVKPLEGCSVVIPHYTLRGARNTRILGIAAPDALWRRRASPGVKVLAERLGSRAQKVVKVTTRRQARSFGGSNSIGCRSTTLKKPSAC